VLSIDVLSAGRGADYYLNKVARSPEDYYLGDGEAPGYWLGAATGQLGVAGQVEAAELTAILAGTQPGTGADLLAQRREDRVPGYDLTFNAPKSASLLAALGPPEVAAAIRDGHDAAVAAAFAYLERHAGHVRRGKDGTIAEPGRGLAGAAFRHRVSRAGDPHLHTHVVTANMVQGGDGRWYAADGRALYREAKTAGMLYRAQLRHELRSLGLQWVVRRDGLSEAGGIPAEVLAAFSRRRGEIVARLGELGLSGPRAAQVATLDTRRAKRGLDGHRLADDWRRRAGELGFGQVARNAVLHRPALPAPDPATETRQLLSEHGVTATSASFHRRDVVQALCVSRTGGDPITTIEADAAAFLAHPGVHRLAAMPDGSGGIQPATPGETRWTTSDILALEQHVLDRAQERAHAGAGTVPASVLGATLAAHELTADQQLAAVRLLTSGAGVDVLVGVAGAGKTYTLTAARHAWAATGHHVIGAAVAARAAARLADTTGITSWTVTRLLRDLQDPRHGPLPPRTVIVVDEAGMLGTRQLAALHHIADRDGAKFVLTGDYRQLPEIDAGGLFRALAQRGAAAALTTNMRHVQPWERAALHTLRDAAPRAVRAALTEYADRGRITVTPDIGAARDQLVTDWWTTLHRSADSEGRDVAAILRESPEAHVILAVRRRAVADLNARARAQLTAAGMLTGPELTVTARGLGQRTFAVGDLVAARRNDYRHSGLLNSDIGTVTAADPATGILTVTLPSGSEHHVRRRYLTSGGLDHGYAHTLHRAQGLTAEHVYLEASDALYRESLYTGLSRGRLTTQLYATSPDPDPRTQLDRDEHHPPSPGPQPLTVLAKAAVRSKAQHAATDLRTTVQPGPGAEQLHATRRDLDTHAAATGSRDPELARRAATNDHQYGQHLRRTGIDAERAARAGQAPHLTILGPPPGDPAQRPAWRDAAARIDDYRRRWHITGPHPLGPPPAASDPAERHDHWHQTRRAADHARHATGRPPLTSQHLTGVPDAISTSSDDQLRHHLHRAEHAQRTAPPDQRDQLAAVQQERAAAATELADARAKLAALRDQPLRQRLNPARRAGHREQLRAATARLDRARTRHTAAAARAETLHQHQAQREQWEHDTAPHRAAGDHARTELGYRAATRAAASETSPPRYLHDLGAVPADPHQRALWRQTAHQIETYRLQHGITDPDQPLGDRPLDPPAAEAHDQLRDAVTGTSRELASRTPEQPLPEIDPG
jgi:conjugative relaxase-like TrwC/TraI family protein